jgi:DNA-binding transcriptional LysR family regulator
MKADPEDVIAFVEVAARGSFSRAARELRVPKSSISRRIRKLEQALSTQLLQRTTRTLHLTEAGLAYYERARRALDELAGAEQVLEGMLEAPSGVLKVTAPIGLEERLGVVLEKYFDRCPDVNVIAHVTNAHADLVREGYDLALRAGLLPDSTLMARKLVDSPVSLWASREYLDRYGEPTTLKQLGSHKLLLLGSSLTATWQLTGPEGVERFKVSGVLAANTFELLLYAAVDGRGIAALPRQLHTNSTLVRVLSDYSIPSPALYAVYPSPNYLSPKVRYFIEICAEVLADYE